MKHLLIVITTIWIFTGCAKPIKTDFPVKTKCKDGLQYEVADTYQMIMLDVKGEFIKC